jgi:hypothetical protein
MRIGVEDLEPVEHSCTPRFKSAKR